MRLELTGRHIDITPGMRRLVDGKLSRLDRLLHDSAVSAQVVFSNDKIGHRADVTVHVRGEKFLHGFGTGAAWQGALSQAFDKVAQQALKVKGKWQERKKRGSTKEEELADVLPAKPARAQAKSKAKALREERPHPLTVLESTRQEVRPMSVSDASRKIGAKELVLVFRNAETMELSVLYRTTSGELMLVETDV
ncbi:MAG: ribosome-associated translation inhibitor RaiA [Acidobacteriaceae bacterium]|jgi:putative sigma-54 modulation protein|nr:ribosome-associated translation inhibitor RaiA [Acidobacteriaceae bacterium]